MHQHASMRSTRIEKVTAQSHKDDGHERTPDASKPPDDSATHARRNKQKLAAHANDTRESKSEEEPLDDLIDTTAMLSLHSKRTERLQKKSDKKKTKKHGLSDIKSFFEIPSELLLEIISLLLPSDIFALIRTNRSMKGFIAQHQQQISQAVLHHRFSIVAKCFPRPRLFQAVNESLHAALLSSRHQQRLLIHKRPYQHLKPAEPQNTCSCMSCVMAWNNLNLVVDLAHWQEHLDLREPITMIPRGGNPTWNCNLIAGNAQVVDKAIAHPLWYVRLLEKHFDTTVRTIVRHGKVFREKGATVIEMPVSKRLYQLSVDDIAVETDGFLQRSGPPSYEFPYHRDKYYTLAAYLPNRRWDDGKWIYYGDLHDTDVAWSKWTNDMELTRAAELTAQLPIDSTMIHQGTPEQQTVGQNM